MNNFDSIQAENFSQRDRSKRISKRDVLPLEIKFNLQELYDRSDGKYKFKDIDGAAIMTIDPVAGTISFGTDLTLTNNVTISGTFNASGTITNTNNKYITAGTEFYRPVSFEHSFTGSATYVDNTGSEFKLNVDDFPGFDIAYEACMAVETSGRTAYSRIYNITDGSAVTGSEITSTAVGITNQSPEPVRSAALTFPSGEKNYIIQRKQDPVGNGGDNMHIYLGALVFIKT